MGAKLPNIPKAWSDTPDNMSGGWQDFALPDGQKLGDVIQQHRSDLRDKVEQLQNDPQSTDGGLGYAAGHYLGMAWPHGAIDFKNQFKGQGNPDDLGKAGNFAYYAIGSGILPDAVLDAGASAYNFYKSVTGQNKDNSNMSRPDTSARSVRDQALTYGAGLK